MSKIRSEINTPMIEIDYLEERVLVFQFFLKINVFQNHKFIAQHVFGVIYVLDDP